MAVTGLIAGSLYKRGRIWWVKWPSTRPGDPHRKSTGKRDKRAALAKANKLIVRQERLDAGLPVVDETVHLLELVTKWGDWLLAKPRERSEKHVRQSMGTVEAFLTDERIVHLEQLTLDAAETWLGRQAEEKDWGGRNWNRHRGYLRAWSRWLRRKGHDVMWRLEGLDTTREFPTPKRALSLAELRSLLEVSPWLWRVIYLTALTTGLRRGELRALTWGDVDFDGGFVRIPGRLTKGKRRALQPLPQLTSGALARLRVARLRGWGDHDPAHVEAIYELHRGGASIEAIRRELDERGWRTPRGRGGPGAYHWGIVKRLLEAKRRRVSAREPVFGAELDRTQEVTWYRHLDAAGIPRETPVGKTSFHSLRKTYGTLLRGEETHAWEIQALMRHTSERLSRETYQEYELQKLLSKVEAAVAEIPAL